MADFNVIIVGAGPAGIAAATGLNRAGVDNILVLERDDELGGIPRHIHHPTFGLLTFKRPMSGPKFIAKILDRCKNVMFKTHNSVLAIKPNGVVEIATPQGQETLSANHIILATGAREQPRHARLISGLRPQGITTTGALQKFIYGAKRVPFERPIIVGTELVSFSALWTLKSAGVKTVAMIEPNKRITTYRPAVFTAQLMGTHIELGAKIIDIDSVKGIDDVNRAGKVRHVNLEYSNGRQQIIRCDGIVFTGEFVGDTALTKQSHLEFSNASNLPKIDQDWLSSDEQISIIGNSIHPADMGDQCYLEGLAAGRQIAQKLQMPKSKSAPTVDIIHHNDIKFCSPSMVRISAKGDIQFDIHLHVTKPYWGKIDVHLGNKLLYSKRHRCQPARRISLRHIGVAAADAQKEKRLEIKLRTPENTI